MHILTGSGEERRLLVFNVSGIKDVLQSRLLPREQMAAKNVSEPSLFNNQKKYVTG